MLLVSNTLHPSDYFVTHISPIAPTPIPSSNNQNVFCIYESVSFPFWPLVKAGRPAGQIERVVSTYESVSVLLVYFVFQIQLIVGMYLLHFIVHIFDF